MFKEIDKSLNGKKVKCWASNRINHKPHETEKVHTLNIHCKIKFLLKYSQLSYLCFLRRPDIHQEAKGCVHGPREESEPGVRG